MNFSLNGVKKWFNSSSVDASSACSNFEKFKSYEDGAKDFFPYTRPSILGLSKEAARASADHEIRPILVAHSELPLNAGYSETINAGKSYLVNEDQAFAEMFCLNLINIDPGKEEQTINKLPYWCFGVFDGHAGSGAALAAVNQLQDIIHEKIQQWKSVFAWSNTSKLPYWCFGVFDGHAGSGAALAAVNQLQDIIHEKIHEIQDIIVGEKIDHFKQPLLREAVASDINFDSLIAGVLEQSFLEMDARIMRDKRCHVITGGCTAVVLLFIKKKLFVANAGDSRAVLCKDWKPIPMSNDHTPETDRNRLQVLAALNPKLLGSEFTRLEYQQKPRRKHIGKKLFCRDRNMTGWALKVINEEDVSKTQMICGSGKSARLLETIGTTRGFGDFELRASYTNIPVKPFLTAEPEVKVYDLSSEEVTENDVLIMATDGLWERVSNEKACAIVRETLTVEDKKSGVKEERRYSAAAQNLVMAARGRNTTHGWRIAKDPETFNDSDLKSSDPASYDDISVFVIPIANCPEKPEVHHYPLNSECKKVSLEQLTETKMDTVENDATSSNDMLLTTVTRDNHFGNSDG